jgi:hypothetical protein
LSLAIDAPGIKLSANHARVFTQFAAECRKMK